jgi:hypothetical protein
MPSPTASLEEIREFLGDEVEDSIIERVADTRASVEEIAEALDQREHEHRFREPLTPSTVVVADVRKILEELPFDDDAGLAASDEEDEDEDLAGLTIVTADQASE